MPPVTVLGLFLFLPLILCHGNCHKVEPLDFFLPPFFSRTNAWNLEPCSGIQLKCSELEAQLVVWNLLTGNLTGIRDYFRTKGNSPKT